MNKNKLINEWNVYLSSKNKRKKIQKLKSVIRNKTDEIQPNQNKE